MAAVVPEEEHAPSLIVAEREAPARGEAAEVLEMGVVLGVEVEEVPARSEEAEVLGATGVVQGVVTWCCGDDYRDCGDIWCLCEEHKLSKKTSRAVRGVFILCGVILLIALEMIF